MTFLWIIGLVRHRLMRLLGAGFGIAVTVALLASLGTFLASSTATMTERATAAVPIDWQVEAVPGADATAIDAAIRKAITLADGSAVIMSVAKYYSPDGKSIQDNGVTPKVLQADVVGATDTQTDDNLPDVAPEETSKKPSVDELLNKAIQILQ